MDLFKRMFHGGSGPSPDSSAGSFIGSPFRAIGLAVCRNSRCTYSPDQKILAATGIDPGPEFAIQDRDGFYYVICRSCGAVERGPVSRDDAYTLLKLAAKISGQEPPDDLFPNAKERDLTPVDISDSVPKMGFLTCSYHPIGSAGDEVEILGAKRQFTGDISYRVRGPDGEGELGSISITDPRILFKMSGTENAEGFVTGGVGQGVTIDKIQFTDAALGNIAVAFSDMESIDLAGTAMTVRLRDSKILKGALERIGPGGSRIIARNTLHLVSGSKHFLPGIIAESGRVTLARVGGYGRSAVPCEITRYG